jgi:hypothetical protein
MASDRQVHCGHPPVSRDYVSAFPFQRLTAHTNKIRLVNIGAIEGYYIGFLYERPRTYSKRYQWTWQSPGSCCRYVQWHESGRNYSRRKAQGEISQRH